MPAEGRSLRGPRSRASGVVEARALLTRARVGGLSRGAARGGARMCRRRWSAVNLGVGTGGLRSGDARRAKDAGMEDGACLSLVANGVATAVSGC